MAAIRETGKMIAGAQSLGNGVQDALGAYKELLFPEFKEERDAKAASTKILLEREHASGSFQVRALDDGKGNKKRQVKRKR